MKRTFIYSDDKSNKFWSIEITDDSFTINYGKVGTSGQTQLKNFSSDAECYKQADKLIAEKMKKGYEEQGDNDDDNDDDNQIVVDLNNESDIKRALETLSKNKKWRSQAAEFGKMEDDEFILYDNLGDSEEDFFDKAAQHNELLPLIEKYIKQADCNEFTGDDDLRVGMNAAYYMALHNDSHIPQFIDLHRRIRPSGGEIQLDHILGLLSSTDNGLKLLAACATFQIDQPDIEISLPDWIEEYAPEFSQKEKLFRYIMQEAAKKKDDEFIFDYITEALEGMGLNYDEDRLEEEFENLTAKKIPPLKSICTDDGDTQKIEKKEQPKTAEPEVDIAALTTITKWDFPQLFPLTEYIIQTEDFTVLTAETIRKGLEDRKNLDQFIHMFWCSSRYSQSMDNRSYVTYEVFSIEKQERLLKGFISAVKNFLPKATDEQLFTTLKNICTIPLYDRLATALKPIQVQPLTGKPFSLIISDIVIDLPAKFTILTEHGCNTDATQIGDTDYRIVSDPAKGLWIACSEYRTFIRWSKDPISKLIKSSGSYSTIHPNENITDRISGSQIKKNCVYLSQNMEHMGINARKCLVLLGAKSGTVMLLTDLSLQNLDNFIEIMATTKPISPQLKKELGR